MIGNQRTRGAVTWWLALFGAGAVSLGGWWTLVAGSPGDEEVVAAALGDEGGPNPGSDPEARTDFNLVTLLLRSGLSAEKLCAAGVSDQDVGDVIQAVKDVVLGNYTTLATADQDLFDTKTACEALRRKVRSGMGDQNDVTQLQQLKADQASCESTRDGLLDSYRTAAEGAMTQAQVTLLEQIQANDSWGVGMEFKVVSRTEPDWVTLREALWNERISAEYGDDPDPTAQALLTTARADGTVTTAKSNLDTLLTAVQAAWNAACLE